MALLVLDSKVAVGAMKATGSRPRQAAPVATLSGMSVDTTLEAPVH